MWWAGWSGPPRTRPAGEETAPGEYRGLLDHVRGEDRRLRTAGRRGHHRQGPLSALIDAVACVLAHGQRPGREETARLALETITRPAIALTAVHALIDGGNSSA
jgi:hypothetical protein